MEDLLKLAGKWTEEKPEAQLSSAREEIWKASGQMVCLGGSRPLGSGTHSREAGLPSSDRCEVKAGSLPKWVEEALLRSQPLLGSRGQWRAAWPGRLLQDISTR